MRLKKPRHKRKLLKPQIKQLCSELGPDDGLDPRWDCPSDGPKKGGRKTLQLCKQVERALNLVLAGDCGDALLTALQVVAVEPAPNSARLLVTLTSFSRHAGASASELLAHLHRASSRLRCEVAMAIHRKKTPELAFRVLTSRSNSNRVE